MIKMNEIFKRLEKAWLSPKLNGVKVWANCPAHDDGNRDLRFYERDNKIIMTCRGGCTKDQKRQMVRNTLKLSPDDLSYKHMKTRQQSPSPEKAGEKIVLRASPDKFLEGEPGKYSVECIRGKLITRRNEKIKIKLMFRVISGKQEDSIVMMFMDLGGKTVWASSTYSKTARIALDRDLRPNEVIPPESVFVGKKFLAQVGWRRREPRGKKANTPDFLRIHWLVRLLRPNA